MLKFEEFEGKSRVEQLDLVGECLEEHGITCSWSKNKRGLRSLYYVGKDTVLIALYKPSTKKDFDFILVDRDFYEEFLADGKNTVSLVKRDRKSDYKAVLSCDGVKFALHRKVLEFNGYDLEDKQVDHIVHDTMINTIDFLRPCTGQQNIANRRNSKVHAKMTGEDIFKTNYKKEFIYNPLLDFGETWYALVLYKMLGLSSKEVCDYNRDYILRHGRLSA